jgi:predicted ribosomally synthesized peptide with nif11-like leader
MSQEQLDAFLARVKGDAALQEALSRSAAADADDTAALARDHGFDVVAGDLVRCLSGALVDYVEEDYSMKPNWWLIP